jgi:peptidoglycan/LPS O-acetylase OafA/YrhL
LQFRSDINGLRAIAVIAVVLFHFNAAWMPGGFAGVDVFFVISGFLMTGIIFRGIEQEKFSIFKFYVARANRIIPALAVLCLVLFVFGWFYLTPLEYKTLGKHAASSIVFFSNVLYWKESSYFAVASHEKWLLHTWSLSVEWQFYIIYPLVLVAMRKFMSVNVMKTVVLTGSVLGFILCVIVTYKWPNPTYYLLHSRAWEMMIGGVAYLYPFTLNEKRKKLVECLGLAMIVGTYFLITKETPWPGYLSIFPVLGSFLLIQAQRNDSFITSNVISQKLGTWSYSIYLWHWPLVVAIYYYSLSDIFIYLGIALSVLLGFMSNKYIEKIKFRNNFVGLFSYLKCKPLYMLLAIGLIGGTIKFSHFNHNKSEPTMLGHNYFNSKGELSFNSSGSVRVLNDVNDLNDLNDLDLLMLGDSHSAHYSYGITISNNLKVAHKWVGSCLPFINSNSEPYAEFMNKEWKNQCHALYKFVNVNKGVPVVVANQWGSRKMECIKDCGSKAIISDYNANMRNELEKLIEFIGDRPVFIIGQVPVPLKSMVRCMRGFSGESCERITSNISKERIKMNNLLSEISDEYINVFFINPFNSICNKVGECNTIINNKNVFYDGNHLSAFGSRKVWPYIESTIVKIVKLESGK